MSLFNEVKEKVGVAARGAAKASSEFVDYAKYKLKLVDIKDEIRTKYILIGEIVYKKVDEGDISISEIDEICAEIKELDDKKTEIEDMISSLKNTKFCSSCGKEMSSASAFCSKCGEKLD